MERPSDHFPSHLVCLPSDIEPLKAAYAFRSHRDDLAKLLQHNLSHIASKLYTKSIISVATLAEAINQVHTAIVRTVSLLSVVEDKIRAEPHVFTEFVNILESEPTLRSIARSLVREYLQGIQLLILYSRTSITIDAGI